MGAEVGAVEKEEEDEDEEDEDSSSRSMPLTSPRLAPAVDVQREVGGF